ncbi:MAG: DUF418 domain-containing protein [Sphingobium sp.]|nr:DUF418 domain-containing protein [Sphingobium sp.]
MPPPTVSPYPAANSPHQGQRLAAPDRLRGLAVMGILLMNIVGFGLPDLAYTAPGAWGLNGLADKIAWTINFLLVDGKMRGLFAMLYGAGLIMMLEKAQQAGQNGWQIAFTRSLWLGVFGLLHYLLLWWGDILTLYAITGLVALMIAAWQEDARQVFIASALIFTLYCLMMLGLMLGIMDVLATAQAPGANPQSLIAAQEMLADMGEPGSTYITEQITLYRGPFAPIFAYNLNDLSLWISNNIYYSCPEILGFMLLGMGMMRNDFITGRWDRARYWAVARWTISIALPPMIVLAYWVWASGFDTLVSFGVIFAWSTPFRIFLTIGITALFLWLMAGTGNMRAASPLWHRIEAVGRISLSNYLLTSAVMTGIFYGWGLGWFGMLSRAQLYWLVPPMWAVMLFWSRLWLDHFSIGPMEWLWRWLIRTTTNALNRG